MSVTPRPFLLSEARVWLIDSLQRYPNDVNTSSKRSSYSSHVDSPHQLPDQTEHQRLGSIDDITPLNPNHVHLVGSGQLDGIVGVLNRLESGQLLPLLGLRHSTPDDTAGNDLVEPLQEDTTVFEVFEQVVNTRIDIQTVQPEGEYSGFSFTLGVKVLDLGRRNVLERFETRVGVEEMSDKGQVQFGVSRDERVGSQESSTVDLIGVLQDLFGTLVQVRGLQGRSRAVFG
jgi:hypothetical protein